MRKRLPAALDKRQSSVDASSRQSHQAGRGKSFAAYCNLRDGNLNDESSMFSYGRLFTDHLRLEEHKKEIGS